MRYSRLFPKTLRNVPRDITSTSYRLLLQAGYIRTLGHGLFSLAPLGVRVIERIKAVIREEMEALGAQEVLVPLVNPADLWNQSERRTLVGSDMVHFHDRNGRELVLAPTHEEAMVELLRSGLVTARDLPVCLYQFQLKFRDEEKVRNCLIRSREFIMKDAYSFHRSFADLNGFLPRVAAAYKRVFTRVGLSFIMAEAGVGYMGGDRSYEFLMPCETGDDGLIRCDRCSYAANAEVAVGAIESAWESPKALQTESAGGYRSITELVAGNGYRRERLLKSMVFTTRNRLVMALVRGDHAVSLEKLSRVLEEPVLGTASPEQIAELGLPVEFLSPIDLPDAAREKLTIVADDTLSQTPNLIAGANNREMVYRNVNFGRDFDAGSIADLVRVPPGSRCRHCEEGRLYEQRAVELGNIFRLGEYYSRTMDVRVRGERGNDHYVHMGSYGIGVGRLLAAVVEQHHDERGIIWPAVIAPFPAFLMSIGKSLPVRDLVRNVHESLGNLALFDDRHTSISGKMKDADLLGIPLLIIVARESIEDQCVEVRDRARGTVERIPVSGLRKKIQDSMEARDV